MAENTRAAQMEERVRNLQVSQTALHETSEQQEALLAEVLKRRNEMRDAMQERVYSSKQSRGLFGPSFGNTSNSHYETQIPTIRWQ